MYNTNFPRDASFLRKSSLKICQVYVDSTKYQLVMSEQSAAGYYACENK